MVTNKVSSALKNYITRDDTSKNLMTFCIQLFIIHNWKWWGSFIAVAQWKYLKSKRLLEQHGVDFDMLDKDYMMYHIYKYATYPSKTFPKFYTRIYDRLKIWIATDGVQFSLA